MSNWRRPLSLEKTSCCIGEWRTACESCRGSGLLFSCQQPPDWGDQVFDGLLPSHPVGLRGMVLPWTAVWSPPQTSVFQLQTAHCLRPQPAGAPWSPMRPT